MKKILLSITAVAGVIGATAQTNPLDIYPHYKGDITINKSYDAKGNLRGTMKYTIADSRVSDETPSFLEIVFLLTDAKNEVVDHGTLYVNYDNENLNVNMSNRPETMSVDNYLSLNTKMVNDFVDSPDPFFDVTSPINLGPFPFEAAEYTVTIGERNRDFVNIKVYGRELVGDEKITTPAGEFNASKITFGLDVYNNDTKKTDKYQGTEWYSVGNGIVRTEITDSKGALVEYSELTELHVQ